MVIINKKTFLNRDKWLERMKCIQEKHPFGPIQEFKNIEGSLHKEKGPAVITPTRCIWYFDGRKHGIDVDIFGTELYYYEGILVPSWLMTHPEKLTLDDVFSFENAEVKYVAIKIYGLEKILDDPRVEIIDHSDDDDYILFKINGVFRLKPLTFIKVTNSSPDKDGSYKPYFLCVPSGMKTWKQAVAWTFRKDENSYHPQQEA